MAKRKLSGFSADFQQQIMGLTTDSPLLLAGTVQSRQKLRGQGQKGEWELFKIEVRGQEGRVISTVVNDPAGIPPIGEFITLPVFVGSNGYLREAKQLNAETF